MRRLGKGNSIICPVNRPIKAVIFSTFDLQGTIKHDQKLISISSLKLVV